MILYVNGCSWSSYSNKEANGKVYGDYLAGKLNANLVNHAIPGSCNSRICRSTARSLQPILMNNKDIVCVLNVATPHRFEFWDNNSKFRSVMSNTDSVADMARKRSQEADDGEYISLLFNHPVYGKKLSQFPEYDLYAKSKIINYNFEQAQYEMYYQLYMLTVFLKHNNIKYLIFAGGNNTEHKALDSSLEWISAFQNPIVNDPAVLNLSDINFCKWSLENGFEHIDADLYGDNGHPGEEAHAAWADFLYNKLTELYGPL